MESREPMHCSQAIFLGAASSDGPHQTSLIRPGAAVNPLIFNTGHYIGVLAVRYCFICEGLKTSFPTASTTAPTASSRAWGCSTKSTASTGQTSAHRPHSVQASGQSYKPGYRLGKGQYAAAR